MKLAQTLGLLVIVALTASACKTPGSGLAQDGGVGSLAACDNTADSAKKLTGARKQAQIGLILGLSTIAGLESASKATAYAALENINTEAAVAKLGGEVNGGDIKLPEGTDPMRSATNLEQVNVQEYIAGRSGNDIVSLMGEARVIAEQAARATNPPEKAALTNLATNLASAGIADCPGTCAPLARDIVESLKKVNVNALPEGLRDAVIVNLASLNAAAKISPDKNVPEVTRSLQTSKEAEAAATLLVVDSFVNKAFEDYNNSTERAQQIKSALGVDPMTLKGASVQRLATALIAKYPRLTSNKSSEVVQRRRETLKIGVK